MTTQAADRREAVARSFVAFAAHCAGNAPLYELLARAVAADDELLAVAMQARPGQPPPNMLFAAAHYLLLSGVEHPLAAFFPTLGGARPPAPEALELLRDLCRAHAGAIAGLLATRLTQTNEVRRSALLLPALALVAGRAGAPLALIEFGPSAGLNLNFDRYAYDYGDGVERGAAGAPLRLQAELRGPLRPPLPLAPPPVAARVGVDLSPIDPADAGATRWLEALVWAEHPARIERLRAALAIARRHPPPLLAGDALDLLPGLLAAQPPGAAVCLYHTQAVYQLDDGQRARLDAALAAASAGRPVYRLGFEGVGAQQPELWLTVYGGGAAAEQRLLAVATGHVNWIEWRDGGAS